MHDLLLHVRALVSPSNPHPLSEPRQRRKSAPPPPIKAGTFFAVEDNITGSTAHSTLPGQTQAATSPQQSDPSSSEPSHADSLFDSSSRAKVVSTYAQKAAQHRPAAPNGQHTVKAPQPQSSCTEVISTDKDMGDVVVIHPKVREIPRKEGASPCTLMLVTANVGTLFEQV